MNLYSSIKSVILVLLATVLPIAAHSQCGISFTMITQNVECNGDCDGYSSTFGLPTGGSPPYTYLWDDPGTTTDFFTPPSLCAGIYNLTVSDNTGCDTVVTITITEPTALVAALTSVDACFNQCNGQVNLGASGGGDQSGSPYDYIFENASTTTTQTGTVDSLFTFSNLCPGTYNVTITDPLSCDGTNTVVVNEATDYTRNITATDASCFNVCDGTATITMGGSQPPYTYLWSSGDTTSTATGLCGSQGGTTYSVTITDTLGCTFDTMTTVSEPAEIVVNLDFKSDPSCGVCDGVIQVSVSSGGVSPFTYNWSSGQSASTIANLCAGSYTVTVTDGNGCDTNETYVLVDQAPMTAEAISALLDCAGGSGIYIGTATVTSGGVSPYTYAWSNGQTSSIAVGLIVNQTYTVDITDSQGCQTQATVTVQPQPCPVEVPNVFSPNGDGINDTWDIKNLSLYPECEVKVHNRWGDIVFKQTGYDTPESPQWEGTSLGLIPLPFGVYYYVIENVAIENFAAGYKHYGSVTIVK
ncbi:MAG TPA: T9SS type B sorting domain-containing protein [Flavobacteriales bacterium]|nr:T9SS type B sorting domain-containing protein [Flavobacteriales bacterium]